MKKTFFCAVFVIFLNEVAFGQQSLVLDAWTKKWKNSKIYLVEVAKAMPENEYNFKPVPEEMSFEEQLKHIVGNVSWLTSEFVSKQKNPFSKEIIAKAKTKTEIIDLLEKTFDFAQENVNKLTENNFGEQVDFFVKPMNKLQILNLLQDHQTHHRAQAIVYLRLKGIKPPAFRGW